MKKTYLMLVASLITTLAMLVTVAIASSSSDSALVKRAKLSQSQAAQIALGAVFHNSVKSAEIEEEMGLPPGGFNRGVAAAFIDERRPQESADEHYRFLTAFYRLTTLGRKHFGFPLQPAEAAAAEAGEAAAAAR